MHALQMRAASLGASALLLGAAVFGAVTLKFVTSTWTLPDPPATPMITVETPPPPPVVPETVRQTTPPSEDAEVAPPEVTPFPFDTPISTDVGSAGGTAAPQLPTIANPHWRSRPADLGRYYPRRATEAGVQGVVVLDCLVRTDGRLNCAVASETPQNWRFGEAAQAIARDHRMEPAVRDGVPVEARYTMRVPFTLR